MLTAGDTYGGPIFRDLLTFSGCSRPVEMVDVPAPFVRYVNAVCCESLREWGTLREGVEAGLQVVCRSCTLVAPGGVLECEGCGAALVADAVEPLAAVMEAHVTQQRAMFGDVGMDALETLAVTPDVVLELLVPGSLTALLGRAAAKRGAFRDDAVAVAQMTTLMGAVRRYLLVMSECVRAVTAAAAGAKASAATAMVRVQAQALRDACWAFWTTWGDVSSDVPCMYVFPMCPFPFPFVPWPDVRMSGWCCLQVPTGKPCDVLWPCTASRVVTA